MMTSQQHAAAGSQSQGTIEHQYMPAENTVQPAQMNPYGQRLSQIQNQSPTFGQRDPGEMSYPTSPGPQAFTPTSAGGPPQLPHVQVSTSIQPPLSTPISGPGSVVLNTNVPSPTPVFGVSLDDLLSRDGSAIPLVVYQCIQAVDLFGLDVEGIYRLSGSAIHISNLWEIFNNGLHGLAPQTLLMMLTIWIADPSQVDFRNPEHFFHDVNSVAGLLKQFFRELPDPLLTNEHFQEFVEAARKLILDVVSTTVFTDGFHYQAIT